MDELDFLYDWIDYLIFVLDETARRAMCEN